MSNQWPNVSALLSDDLLCPVGDQTSQYSFTNDLAVSKQLPNVSEHSSLPVTKQLIFAYNLHVGLSCRTASDNIGRHRPVSLCRPVSSALWTPPAATRFSHISAYTWAVGCPIFEKFCTKISQFGNQDGDDRHFEYCYIVTFEQNCNFKLKMADILCHVRKHCSRS